MAAISANQVPCTNSLNRCRHICYLQEPHYGGFQISALMLALSVSLAVVYFTQQWEGGGRPARKLRSTDYTD